MIRVQAPGVKPNDAPIEIKRIKELILSASRRGDQGQDRADENVDSDRIGGVIFTNSQVAIKPLGDLCESGCGT